MGLFFKVFLGFQRSHPLSSPRCMEEAHGEVEVLNEADKGKPLQPAFS